jgi:hypothetical protein
MFLAVLELFCTHLAHGTLMRRILQAHKRVADHLSGSEVDASVLNVYRRHHQLDGESGQLKWPTTGSTCDKTFMADGRLQAKQAGSHRYGKAALCSRPAPRIMIKPNTR